MTSAPQSPAAPIQRCDILIIGAGPAGMAAALAAAPSGAAIVLVDDNPAPGGQIWRDGPGAHLPPLARTHRERLAGAANVRVLTGTRVVGLGGGAQPGDAPALLLEDGERGTRQSMISTKGIRDKRRIVGTRLDSPHLT